VVVPPGKHAVITTFGAMGNPPRVAGPGLSVKWPWPIGGAHKYPTGRVRSFEVGAQHQGTSEHFLWAAGQGGAGDEDYLLMAPPRMDRADMAASVPIGELLGARMQVKYSIRDLGKYVRAGGAVLDQPRLSETDSGDDHAHGDGTEHGGYERLGRNAVDRLLRLLAQRAMSGYFATHTIGGMLSGGRNDAGQVLRQRLQAAAEQRALGVEVSYAGLVNVHPPQARNVVQAFHQVIAARQEKQTMIQGARQEAVNMLAGVAGSRQMAQNISEAKARLEQLQQKLESLRQASQPPEQAPQGEAAAITGGESLALSESAPGFAPGAGLRQR
jgi:regulator of protease activity HflC (stomatin/prohibitin superfamily)